MFLVSCTVHASFHLTVTHSTILIPNKSQGPSFSPRPSRAPPSSTQRVPDYGIKYIIVKLKGEVRSFGLLGFIGLQRRFRAIDRDNTKFLSLADFKKVGVSDLTSIFDGALTPSHTIISTPVRTSTRTLSHTNTYSHTYLNLFTPVHINTRIPISHHTYIN